jgi:hypothetical protein
LKESGKTGNAFATEVFKDVEMFTQEFQGLTKERVKIFCELCPSLRQAWMDLGFET